MSDEPSSYCSVLAGQVRERNMMAGEEDTPDLGLIKLHTAHVARHVLYSTRVCVWEQNSGELKFDESAPAEKQAGERLLAERGQILCTMDVNDSRVMLALMNRFYPINIKMDNTDMIPQIDGDRAVGARPAFCCFPPCDSLVPSQPENGLCA
ncbi:unnamed protein product [Pleuronectes platessa]|uniref:Uncharacterized protein n=1 Tax=Pleuronectes platessa TaxID=8262 RepID=A0A9N7UFW2_PLEPL|nr:unnamed protein product [Pleuronectes platessa]